MKPVFQTVFHAPGSSVYGNCFSAFLASALEIPLEDVPHFLHDGCDAAEWRKRINAFLRPLNLAFIEIGDARQWMTENGITGLTHERSGQTARGSLHATLAVDGATIHDPLPDSLGLVSERSSWGVFVVLDPAKPIGKQQFAQGVSE